MGSIDEDTDDTNIVYEKHWCAGEWFRQQIEIQSKKIRASYDIEYNENECSFKM